VAAVWKSRMINLGIINSQAIPPLNPGLINWFDIADLSTVFAAGDLAEGVFDKSLSGNSLIATGPRRPTTGTRNINGLNVFDFDGVDNRMVFDFQPLTGTVARTIIVVGYADAAVNQNILVSLAEGGVTDGDLYDIGCQISVRGGGGVNNIFSNDPIDNGIPAILIITNKANSTFESTAPTNNLNAYKNGKLLFSAESNNADSSVNTRVSTASLGDQFSGTSNRLDGVIGEIQIYNFVLSTIERQQRFASLSNKWRIPLAA